MLIIPVQALPNQTFAISLDGQNCNLNIYQTAYGLFMDIYMNSALIIGGVICQNLNRIIRDLYFGFAGDFVWYDNTGNGTDPYYLGLGTTYTLYYLETSDLDGLG
jgi:hypothetical protein